MIEAHIPAQLMEELGRKWPDKCPEANWADREIWAYVGARKLVEALQASFNKQQKDAAKKIL